MDEIKKFLQVKKGKKNPYVQIINTPLRYAGGKSKAVGLILENFPKLKNKLVVSPFFGGGSLELTLTRDLGFKVIGYDIFGILVNF